MKKYVFLLHFNKNGSLQNPTPPYPLPFPTYSFTPTKTHHYKTPLYSPNVHSYFRWTSERALTFPFYHLPTLFQSTQFHKKKSIFDRNNYQMVRLITFKRKPIFPTHTALFYIKLRVVAILMEFPTFCHVNCPVAFCGGCLPLPFPLLLGRKRRKFY